MILNVSGLNVGPSAAQHAAENAYTGCIAFSKDISKPKGQKALRLYIEGKHLFMAGLTELVQQDPILLQLLRQNEQLELQLGVIDELRSVNQQLGVQCELLDEQM